MLSTLLALMLCLVGLSAGADSLAGNHVSVGSVADDLYAAGRTVTVDGAVDGDAILAAGRVSVTGDVAGDSVIAGGRVRIDGGVGDDLRVFAGSIALSGFVTDHAAVFARRVHLESGSAIAGRVWIAAAEVTANGAIGGDLEIAANTVTLNGRVAGNVEIDASDIRIGSDAVILGDFHWRGTDAPDIDAGARIQGELRHGDGGSRAASPEATHLADEPRGGPRWSLIAILFVAAAAALWLAPGLVRRMVIAVRAAPGRSLLVGAAVFLLTPPAAILLIITVIGALLGILLLTGFVFVLALAGVLGLVVASELVVSAMAARRRGVAVRSDDPGTGQLGRGWTMLALFIVTAAVVSLQAIPVLGGLAATLLVLVGLGAPLVAYGNRR